MKKVITLCFFILITLKSKSQCPWSFTITNNTGSYTLTCTNPTINLSATNNNTNVVSYLWTGPTFTSNVATASITLPGNYSLVVTDAVTSCSLQQTFSLSQNTLAPTTSVSPISQTISCAGGGITNFTGTTSNPTINLQQDWYGPLSPPPVGPPIQSSNNYVTIQVPPFPGMFTLVTTNLVNGCTTQNTVICLQPSTSFNHTVIPVGVVNFQNTTVGTNSSTTYSWNFGDGTVGSGSITSHTYTNGGIHNVVLSTFNPSCNPGAVSVNVNTIPCNANSNFTLIYSGTPQTWLAYPAYYGNVIGVTWAWGDGNSDNWMFPSHTYSAAGLYNICLSVTVSCAGSSSTCSGYNIFKTVDINQAMVTVSVVSAPPVGLKQIEEENISFDIYPNPNTGNFNIQNSSQKSGTVKIFSLEGKEIKNLGLEVNKETTIENLNEGIYFVEINCGESILRKKIVVLN